MSLRIDLGRGCARIFCAFVAVACVAGTGSGARANEPATYIDIGKNEIGAPPAEFDLLPRRGEDRQGRWTIIHDATAMAGLAIEQSGVETTEDRFPLAISKAAPLKNVEVSLRLDRVLFSLVTDGVPEDIVGVDADIASHTWHTLAVRARDDQFVVSLDGTWVFTGFDRTLSEPRRIALWTKGDSVTRFDSIAITPLPAAEEGYR